MTKDRIAILMSTYNGEKYVEDQVESILDQDYSDLHIYIRDDNSKDGTRPILRKMSKKYSKVTFINDDETKNIGVTASFFELLLYTKADYYMFSDQDDVWLKNKVSKTLNKMKQIDDVIRPSLVHTNLFLVNNKLDIIGKNIWGESVSSNFRDLIFTNNVAGCTVMINNSMREVVKGDKNNWSQMFMHDWWLALIAAGFGNIGFIETQTMYYRQHQGNVVGGMDGFFNRVVRLSKIDNELKRSSKMLKQAKTFYEMHGNELNQVDANYLRQYYKVYQRKSRLFNLKVLEKFPPRKSTKSGKILLSFFMICMPKKLISTSEK